MGKIPTHSDLAHYSFVCDELNGMTLECFFEYEDEELGSVDGYGLKNEPDYPEQWNLLHVYLPDGLDIAGILHESILEDIQDQAVTQFMMESADIYEQSRLP